MNGIQLLVSRVNFVLINFYILTIEKIWYLSAIEIIDTQVARRGRQYHRNPPPYKNHPTKKNRIYKIKKKRVSKNTTTTAVSQPNQSNPHQPPNPNPTHTTHAYKKRPLKKNKIVSNVK